MIPDPKIKTKVVHSETHNSWNIVGTQIGRKHKIARVPYNVSDSEILNTREKAEALHHATFISECFNKSDIISQLL